MRLEAAIKSNSVMLHVLYEYVFVGASDSVRQAVAGGCPARNTEKP